jgi:hypothetical protein
MYSEKYDVKVEIRLNWLRTGSVAGICGLRCTALLVCASDV